MKIIIHSNRKRKEQDVETILIKSPYQCSLINGVCTIGTNPEDSDVREHLLPYLSKPQLYLIQFFHWYKSEES